MKLTPMNAEEATARSAPLRLAAKRSAASASATTGIISGVRWRRRAAGAFESSSRVQQVRIWEFEAGCFSEF
jgi:hypothetical protein